MSDKLLFTAALLIGWPILLAALLFQAVFFATVGVGLAIWETWHR